jgi:hypothetical protein
MDTTFADHWPRKAPQSEVLETAARIGVRGDHQQQDHFPPEAQVFLGCYVLLIVGIITWMWWDTRRDLQRARADQARRTRANQALVAAAIQRLNDQPG